MPRSVPAYGIRSATGGGVVVHQQSKRVRVPDLAVKPRPSRVQNLASVHRRVGVSQKLNTLNVPQNVTFLQVTEHTEDVLATIFEVVERLVHNNRVAQQGSAEAIRNT